MTSSPGTRQRAAPLALALAAGLVAACAAPQPEACAAYLACFFPEGEKSPYRDVPGTDCSGEDPPANLCEAELATQGEKAHAYYGPTGECWRNGTGDPLYQTCLSACLSALRVECALAEEAKPRESYCVVGEGDERRFEPPAEPSLAKSCVELEQS